MALYLVQHGRANPAEADAERGLTAEGRAEVERIADVARGYCVKVAAIIQSGKKRALQTAEIFAARLGPGIGIIESPGMGPNDDVVSFTGLLDAAGNRMYVGHLPFMEKLASCLVTGATDRPVFTFQNGGIVCLDIHPVTGTWVIRWTLMPNIG